MPIWEDKKHVEELTMYYPYSSGDREAYYTASFTFQALILDNSDPFNRRSIACDSETLISLFQDPKELARFLLLS